MNGPSLGQKTDRDYLMKENLGCYCLKIFEMARERKEGGSPGIKPRISFFFFPLPQRSSDSNGPCYLSLDDLYRSLDPGDPIH